MDFQSVLNHIEYISNNLSQMSHRTTFVCHFNFTNDHKLTLMTTHIELTSMTTYYQQSPPLSLMATHLYLQVSSPLICKYSYDKKIHYTFSPLMTSRTKRIISTTKNITYTPPNCAQLLQNSPP